MFRRKWAFQLLPEEAPIARWDHLMGAHILVKEKERRFGNRYFVSCRHDQSPPQMDVLY